jgi:hypothetical protein
MRRAARPTTHSPYVRLRPLAYITGRGPRGSIGSPPGRGAEPYRMGPRHVSVPDPCLVFNQGLSIFRPGAPGPRCEWSRPLAEGSGSHLRGLVCTRGGPGPPLGVLSTNLGVRRTPMGVRTYCKCPRVFHHLGHVAALDPPRR